MSNPINSNIPILMSAKFNSVYLMTYLTIPIRRQVTITDSETGTAFPSFRFIHEIPSLQYLGLEPPIILPV